MVGVRHSVLVVTRWLNVLRELCFSAFYFPLVRPALAGQVESAVGSSYVVNEVADDPGSAARVAWVRR